MTTLLPLTVLGHADGPLDTRPTRPGHEPARSRLTSEVFVVPHDGRHLVYAPLRRTAFVTNAAGVAAPADLQDGRHPAGGDDLVTLLTALGLCDGHPRTR
jgi:hypothetical protein